MLDRDSEKSVKLFFFCFKVHRPNFLRSYKYGFYFFLKKPRESGNTSSATPRIAASWSGSFRQPYSAKPAKWSSHTSPPGCIVDTVPAYVDWRACTADYNVRLKLPPLHCLEKVATYTTTGKVRKDMGGLFMLSKNTRRGYRTGLSISRHCWFTYTFFTSVYSLTPSQCRFHQLSHTQSHILIIRGISPSPFSFWKKGDSLCWSANQKRWMTPPPLRRQGRLNAAI